MTNVKTKASPEDPQFIKILNDLCAETKAEFLSKVKDSLPDTSFVVWNISELTTHFYAVISEASFTKKEQALEKMKKQMEKKIAQSFAEPVALILDKGQQNMWSSISQAFLKVYAETVKLYEKRFRDFELSEDEFEDSMLKLKISIWQTFIDALKSTMLDVHVMDRLRTRFESKFKYDDKGLPRIWKMGDDVDSVFSKAKEEVIALRIYHLG
jgi:hypothetical protein